MAGGYNGRLNELERESGRGLLSPVALAEAVTANSQGMGVVRQAIQSGAGQQVVVEDFSPFIKCAVAGDDQGATLC